VGRLVGLLAGRISVSSGAFSCLTFLRCDGGGLDSSGVSLGGLLFRTGGPREIQLYIIWVKVCCYLQPDWSFVYEVNVVFARGAFAIVPGIAFGQGVGHAV
jgi:hypothetical protein